MENARKTTVKTGGSRSDDKKKRTKIDGGLFSKLSIAFSLEGEDEDYEVEVSGSEEEASTVIFDFVTNRVVLAIEPHFIEKGAAISQRPRLDMTRIVSCSN